MSPFGQFEYLLLTRNFITPLASQFRLFDLSDLYQNPFFLPVGPFGINPGQLILNLRETRRSKPRWRPLAGPEEGQADGERPPLRFEEN